MLPLRASQETASCAIKCLIPVRFVQPAVTRGVQAEPSGDRGDARSRMRIVLLHRARPGSPDRPSQAGYPRFSPLSSSGPRNTQPRNTCRSYAFFRSSPVRSAPRSAFLSASAPVGAGLNALPAERTGRVFQQTVELGYNLRLEAAVHHADGVVSLLLGAYAHATVAGDALVVVPQQKRIVVLCLTASGLSSPLNRPVRAPYRSARVRSVPGKRIR